jgi:O-antigen/teichoic acid export membrane protein
LFLLLVPVLVLGEGRLLESMVVFLAVNALAAIWLLGWLVRTIGVSTTIDAGEARQGMRFGARSYLNHLTMRLHDQLDLFIVAYLLPQAEEVAYYAVAAGTVGRMVVLPTSMALAIYPRLAGAPDDEAARFSSFVTRHAVWLTTATLIIAAPLAAPLFTLLYGSDYRASVAPFWLLLPALPGLTASRLLGRWFLAADRQVPMIVARTLAIAINLIANLMLIPHFGIAGAAAAKSVSLLLEGCVVAFAFSAATGLQLRALLRLRGDDVAPYLRRWRAWRARLSASEPPGPGPSGH